MLNVPFVEAAVAKTAFARLHYVLATASTNDDAAATLGQTETGPSVFVAEYQAAGRGRRGRTWVAPAGSALLVTAVMPSAIPTAALWAVPFWTALCASEAIERATGVRCDLQWPNDLLIAGRKVCGILGVSRIDGARAFVACGTGINVVRPYAAGELDRIVPPPAFLSDEATALEAPKLTRERVLVELLLAYDRALPLLAQPDVVARTWEMRAALEGARYRVLRDGASEPFEAVALGLGDDGTLVVDRDGTREIVAQADARVFR